MPIVIACNCGKRLSVPDELAGRRGKCPACNTVLEIPAAEAPIALPDPLEGLDDSYGLAPSQPDAPQPARSPYASPAPAASRSPSPFAGRAGMGSFGRVAAPVSVQSGGGHITFHFAGVDPNAIASSVQGFFQNKGYRLEKGTSSQGVFGVGSDIARIFAGALAKRYKFKVDIVGGSQNAQLTVSKGMSGISGAVLGYMAMSKETKKVLKGLRTHFGG